MALTKVGKGALDKGAIKNQTDLGGQAADTDRYLVYDASADDLKYITAANVTPNETLITDKDEITIGNVATNDVLLIYDTSSGTLKKITKAAFDALQPSISSTTSNLLTGDGTGNFTIVVNGEDFDTAATFKLVTEGGTDISMDSVSRDSSTLLTGTVAKNKANLTNANEPFDVVVTNGNGLSVTSANAINIDAQPAWVTSSGSLGTLANYQRSGFSSTVEATDPESGAITYAHVSGSLPGGISLNTTTGVISGNADAVGSNTTYNFTIEARDANSNATERDFSITVQAPVAQSFTSSGTFSVPSGLTSVDVLVIAGGGGGGKQPGNGGGGGGAGGLIYRPGFPVTPGGSIPVTVGCGGPSTTGDGTPNPARSGQDSVFGTLTAKGGGAGGVHNHAGVPGGSGGGAGRDGPQPGGSATQPNQAGDSGTYGFGFAGGNSGPGGSQSGGGGGGAGGTGKNGFGSDHDPQPGTAGAGGDGKLYSISGSSVGYAGGGTGSAQVVVNNQPLAYGGGYFTNSGGTGTGNGTAGAANRGAGGGSGRGCGYSTGAGGKGIVIVSY